MSLVNQLIAAIFAVLIGLVSGTLYIMSESSRSILQDQLESHAQDSATHLGLYLAPYIADNDSATVETAVSAIFDSGFYQRIIVTNADEEVLFEKEAAFEASSEVPEWFTQMVKITPPAMFREVTHQWRKAGKIYVQSRAGYAYEKLWRGAQDSIILFVTLSIVCLIAISSLVRYLLRPLQRVEDQAVALAEKRYIEQEKLPATRELKRVVMTMNKMVQQVKSMFEEQTRHIEELRRSAYQDSLTGLANQRSTQAQLAERIDYRQDFGRGVLIHVHLCDLQAINSDIGVDKTNTLLKSIANLLQALARKADQSILGRISGADFVILSSRLDQDKLKREFEYLDSESRKQLEQLSGQSQTKPIISIGSCVCDDQSNTKQLLSEALLAANQAAKDAVLWQQFDNQQQTTSVPDNTDWKQHVANAINGRHIFLQVQTLFSKGPNRMPIQDELFARILDQQGTPAPAGEFINVAKQLGLMVEMDKAVIELALTQAADRATPFTINLSQEAITTPEFHTWLRKQLKKIAHKSNLLFEIDETCALNHIDSVLAFRETIKPLGIGFGVDHFGVHPSGFSYLYAVQPDYVKIDGALIRDIDASAEDRFFVNSLIRVAHSLEIKAFAEHVERETQLQLLMTLDADGSQGYLHGAPKPLAS